MSTEHDTNLKYTRSHMLYYATLQATAWIGTGILAVMTAVHFVVLFMYVRRHNQQRRENVPYHHVPIDDPNDQEEPKIVAV